MPPCRLARLEQRSRLFRAVIMLGAGLALALAALAAPAGVLVQPGLAAPLPQGGAPADQGKQLFDTKCISCHTIGGGALVGPDLKDVAGRRDATWMKNFISDPGKMFAANDPTAMQLLQQHNNLKMPTLGLSPAEVDALVAYLRGGAAAAPAPAPGAAAAAAAGDPAAGGRIFTGQAALGGGGPACIGCHTIGGTGTLGGGALGPDLTHVAQRYGQPGLAAALTTIAFPTMVGPFTNRPLTPSEQADLVAFFVQTDQQQPPVPVVAPGAITFDTWRVFGIGLAGALALFGLLVLFWPRQRESVSARLRRRSGVH